MKRILSLLLMTSSLFSMQWDIVTTDQKQPKTIIDKSSLFVPAKLGSLDLVHGKKGFSVIKDEKKYLVNPCLIDPIIRNIDKENLKELLKVAYVCVNETNNGDFTLQTKERQVGGGAFGASLGAFLGKAAVYVLGHGAIQIVALCTGPAYPVTVLALEGCFAGPIEIASMGGAVAGGIALGVATGPV